MRNVLFLSVICVFVLFFAISAGFTYADDPLVEDVEIKKFDEAKHEHFMEKIDTFDALENKEYIIGVFEVKDYKSLLIYKGDYIKPYTANSAYINSFYFGRNKYAP